MTTHAHKIAAAVIEAAAKKAGGTQYIADAIRSLDIDAIVASVPKEAEAPELTDEQIADVLNGADFASMVTADDFMFVCARAIERKVRALLSAQAEAAQPAEPSDETLAKMRDILFSGRLLDTFLICDLYRAAIGAAPVATAQPDNEEIRPMLSSVDQALLAQCADELRERGSLLASAIERILGRRHTSTATAQAPAAPEQDTLSKIGKQIDRLGDFATGVTRHYAPVAAPPSPPQQQEKKGGSV